MGQPRLRLVSKAAAELEDDTPLPLSPTRSKGGDAMDSPTSSRPKRTRKSDFGIEETSDSVSAVKEGCLKLYQAVKEMDKDGEPLCLAFNKLPSKKEYPDYYVEIKRPIALDIMKSKITRGVYKSVSEFVEDIDLMCSNAQTYNIPESYIYEIAGDIKRNVHTLAADMISSDAAPTAATPQLKLRIRQASLNKSGEGTDDESASDDDLGRSAATPSFKRKRGKKRADSESGESDYDRPAIATAAPKSASKTKASQSTSGSDADAALDELFQAIYDADLTTALRILDTPGLQLNGYRKVVMKEPNGDVVDNDEYTWAPLHAASCYGRLKVAKVLCDKGADIEAVDTMHKSTPLAWAAYTGRKRMAKCFVREYKANVNARNAHDQLPIQIVLDPENPRWAEFLMPTDGSKVDLPEPKVAPVSTPEPRKSTLPKRNRAPDSVDASQLPQQTAATTTILRAPSQSHMVAGQIKPELTAAMPQSLNRVLNVPLSPPMLGATISNGQSQTSVLPGGPPIPQCIGGIGHQEVVHPQMATAMKDIVAQLLETKDEDGASLTEVFEDPPDRSEYPEYYEVIFHPMALNVVKSRIDAGYRSFDAFNYDMLWIFNNATYFNESDSQIYQDAVVLENAYKQICRQVIAKYQITFDLSYIDAVPSEGRYVSRASAGELDLCVGDFIYVKTSSGGMKVAMITKIRVGGVYDRRKFFDGRWFLTPSEVPEIAGQPVYPHQLFAGPVFDSLGVRSIAGKCYILLPAVYARVYPQGFNAQDIYVCESIYEPGNDGQPGKLTPITNWAHDFKTPLMRPPAFISYITPFTLNKRTVELWNNTSLLPHLGLTVLNREAMAKMQQAQNLARSQPQQQTPTRQQAAPRSAQPMAPMAMGGGAALMRPPSGMQIPQAQNNFAQAQQALTAHHQQNLAMAQSQQTQRESRIRKQASEQIAAAQQQNPGFTGSPHHQAIVRQKTQLIEQSQQAFFSQTRQLQQSYNQQLQALAQTYQQQHPSLAAGFSQPMSPMMAGQYTGPPMNQMGMSSPMSSMGPLPMAAASSVQLGMPQGVFSPPPPPPQFPLGMAGSPYTGAMGPGIPGPSGFDQQAFQAQNELQRMGDGGFAGGRATTPSRAPNGAPIGQVPMSSPMPPGANAQSMMTMLLQQQQQQLHQQQQQPGTPSTPTMPKQTLTPLSPDPTQMNGMPPPMPHSYSSSGVAGSPSAQNQNFLTPQQQAQNQQAMELWKKATRVFQTDGNQRILATGPAIQILASDMSLFKHIDLSGVYSNHALSLRSTATSALLRPVPGPFRPSGKTVLTISVNGRRIVPRILPDSVAQPSENGMSDDTPSHGSDEAEKDEAGTLSMLAKNANYAFDLPLVPGLNVVDMEVLAAEWQVDALLSESADQQVPPAQPPMANGQPLATKVYTLLLTRQQQ
ncbi:hypothetical protein GGH93_003369 [Coemansia aciculifera]|nr:hypothetical protein GGH93_003369 [Coemansia aciculifera]